MVSFGSGQRKERRKPSKKRMLIIVEALGAEPNLAL